MGLAARVSWSSAQATAAVRASERSEAAKPKNRLETSGGGAFEKRRAMQCWLALRSSVSHPPLAAGRCPLSDCASYHCSLAGLCSQIRRWSCDWSCPFSCLSASAHSPPCRCLATVLAGSQQPTRLSLVCCAIRCSQWHRSRARSLFPRIWPTRDSDSAQ